MKKISFIVWFALFALVAKAQNIEQLFAEMPDNIIPVMTTNNRLDCIDFYKSNMKSKVENIYGGQSELLALNGEYLFLCPTKKSSVAMRKFSSTTGEPVIAAVFTYNASVKDSEVVFYTKEWKKIPVKSILSMPAKEDFIIDNDTFSKESRDFLKSVLQDMFLYAELSEKENTMSFMLSSDALTEENKEKVQQFIKNKISFKWNGKTLVR